MGHCLKVNGCYLLYPLLLLTPHLGCSVKNLLDLSGEKSKMTLSFVVAVFCCLVLFLRQGLLMRFGLALNSLVIQADLQLAATHLPQPP